MYCHVLYGGGLGGRDAVSALLLPDPAVRPLLTNTSFFGPALPQVRVCSAASACVMKAHWVCVSVRVRVRVGLEMVWVWVSLRLVRASHHLPASALLAFCPADTHRRYRSH